MSMGFEAASWISFLKFLSINRSSAYRGRTAPGRHTNRQGGFGQEAMNVRSISWKNLFDDEGNCGRYRVGDMCLPSHGGHPAAPAKECRGRTAALRSRHSSHQRKKGFSRLLSVGSANKSTERPPPQNPISSNKQSVLLGIMGYIPARLLSLPETALRAAGTPPSVPEPAPADRVRKKRSNTSILCVQVLGIDTVTHKQTLES